MATNAQRTELISAEELRQAYRFARLRSVGIGFSKAIETPHLYTALHCTAQALKRKQQQPQQEATI